jgi:hypothetical protein
VLEKKERKSKKNVYVLKEGKKEGRKEQTMAKPLQTRAKE